MEKESEGRAAVTAACTERFEPRLVEDFSELRVQTVQFESGIRQDLAQLGAGLREEMATFALGLRQEMATFDSGLRDAIAAARVDLFKWCFLFWVGQVLAIGGLLAVMLRLTR